jgi:heme/copper-type cytochrome/quinol oxidase subunit 2
MLKLFNQLLTHLGSPKEQKTESVALVVVYSMTIAFITVMVTVMLMVLCSSLNSSKGDRIFPSPVLEGLHSQSQQAGKTDSN